MHIFSDKKLKNSKFWTFGEQIPATRTIFCPIFCPGAKNDGRIPGGGAKFSQTRRNCSLTLFDMGEGMMALKMFLTTVLKRVGGGS